MLPVVSPTGMDNPAHGSQRTPVQAWARKYAWIWLLVGGVVLLVHAATAGRRYPGLSDPVGCVMAGGFFAVSAWLFFRRNRL